MVMRHCARYRLYCACNRIAVGPFKGQGCERSELPCLARGDKELDRRSWSFSPKRSLDGGHAVLRTLPLVLRLQPHGCWSF